MNVCRNIRRLPKLLYSNVLLRSNLLKHTCQKNLHQTTTHTFSRRSGVGHLLKREAFATLCQREPLTFCRCFSKVMMTDEEQYALSENFKRTFAQILRDVSENSDPGLQEATKWFEKAVEYNVPHGKRGRGLLVVWSYKVLVQSQNLSQEAISLAYVLGWCVEMLQAFYLVVDDIMDGSITRRGRPCWYKVDDVGLVAINDAGFLLNCVFFLLKKYFSQRDCYVHLINLFIEVNQKTHLGQCLDMLSSSSKHRGCLDHFTPERYAAIVKHKTSYYSFALPVRLAMYLTDCIDEQLHADAERLLLKIGHFYQVQDDFLDCFGDPTVMGKIGTDIEDGKCSWLIVNALRLASDDQRTILKENYGVPDAVCADRVKEVYHQLQFANVYNRYEQETFNEINRLIAASSTKLPPQLFHSIVQKIYAREK